MSSSSASFMIAASTLLVRDMRFWGLDRARIGLLGRDEEDDDEVSSLEDESDEEEVL